MAYKDKIERLLKRPHLPAPRNAAKKSKHMIAALYSAMVIEDPKKIPEKEEMNHDVTGIAFNRAHLHRINRMNTPF
jgi:hypothetical protein